MKPVIYITIAAGLLAACSQEPAQTLQSQGDIVTEVAPDESAYGMTGHGFRVVGHSAWQLGFRGYSCRGSSPPAKPLKLYN